MHRLRVNKTRLPVCALQKTPPWSRYVKASRNPPATAKDKKMKMEFSAEYLWECFIVGRSFINSKILYVIVREKSIWRCNYFPNKL